MSFPELIAVYPEKIVFPTAPDEDYTILYRGTPTLVTTDSPSTYQINMPSAYRKAIAPLACYYAFRDVKK